LQRDGEIDEILLAAPEEHALRSTSAAEQNERPYPCEESYACQGRRGDRDPACCRSAHDKLKITGYW
jgi:hypothetical protein